MPGALAVRDPHLRAVDDVLVAVARGPARDVARVAAGVGLRERQARRGARRWRGAGSHRCFCSSVPWCTIRCAAIVCVLTMPDSDIQPYASSSIDADVGEEVEPEPAVLLGDRDRRTGRAPSSARRSRRDNSSACSSSDATGHDLAGDEPAHGRRSARWRISGSVSDGHVATHAARYRAAGNRARAAAAGTVAAPMMDHRTIMGFQPRRRRAGGAA